MDYLKYLNKHSELVLKALRPRNLGETKDNWLRERMKAEDELSNLEEAYPEFTKRFNREKL